MPTSSEVVARATARPSAAPVTTPAGAWRVICAAGIALITFIAFLPSLGNGFNFDDDQNLERNPAYRGLRPSNLQWMFTTFHMGHYQPLSWVTLGLDYVVWGMNPRGYHLTNMLLHAANAVLVFWLALRLLAPAWPGGAGATPQARSQRVVPGTALLASATLAALLFAIHPLRVESVTWITERRDVLSSFFLIGTVLCYLRAAEAAQPRRRGLLAATWGLYVLSLLSRAMGMTLPVILLLLDWYPLRRLGGPVGFASRTARRIYLEKLPFLLPAVAIAIVAARAQAHTGAATSFESHSIVARLLQAGYGVIFYLWAMVWPVNLSPLYELVRVPGQWPPHHLIATALLVLATAAVAWIGRRQRAIAAAALAYVVLLGPVLGLAQSGQQEVADRYSYLPAIPVALLVAGGLMRGASPLILRPVTWGTCGAALAVLGALTWTQTQVWRDGETLWRHAIACRPMTPTVHHFLGVTLAKLGRHGEALGSFEQALRISPGHRGATVGLAKSLSESGRWEEAEQAWRRAVDVRPGEWEPVQNLANALLMRGKLEEAAAQFTRASEIDPRQLETWLNLSATHLRLGRTDDAIAAARQAAQGWPSSAGGHYNLGNALFAAERLDEALAAYRAALACDPNLVEAHVNGGFVLDRLGRVDEAIAAYRTAIRVDARRVEPRMNLAELLLRLGRREAAADELEALLRIKPDFEAARRILATLRTGGGD